jgi:hypothetical protein
MSAKVNDMKMTIEDYIKRHGLAKREVKSEWVPSMLIPEDGDDKVEIYANDDGSHVVAINTTRKRFRIVHGDMVFLTSEWLDARNNYETDARPFWSEGDFSGARGL